MTSTSTPRSEGVGYFVLQSFVAGNVSVWYFKASP